VLRQPVAPKFAARLWGALPSAALLLAELWGAWVQQPAVVAAGAAAVSPVLPLEAEQAAVLRVLPLEAAEAVSPVVLLEAAVAPHAGVEAAAVAPHAEVEALRV
jgi:hypothetical protein